MGRSFQFRPTAYRNGSPHRLQEPWRGLYDLLHAPVMAAEATVDAGWDGTDPAGTLLSADISTASGSRGAALIANGTPSFYVTSGAWHQTVRMAQLGLPCITYSIGYPLLDPNFHTTTDYETFYTDAAAHARSLNLSIVAKTGVVFRSSSLAPGTYYDSLADSVIQDRYAAHCARVAAVVEPDYITLGAEPTNQFSILGMAAPTASSWAAFVGEAATAVRAENVAGMEVCAGTAAWEVGATDYYDALAALTSTEAIDLLQMNVYPVISPYLANVVTLADYCWDTHAKRCVIGESWCYKATSAELSSNIAAAEALFARDVFSFWSPLDCHFLATLVKAGRWKQMPFVSAFYSQYFHANLTWGVSGTRTTTQQVSDAATAAASAILAGTYTNTGTAYSRMVSGIYP